MGKYILRYEFLFVGGLVLYQLMHDDIEVATFQVSASSGKIMDITSVQNYSHMPLSTVVRKDVVDTERFKEWWYGRSIPSSRSDIHGFFDSLDVSNNAPLLIRSMALSLSDHYWVKPVNSECTWSDVNYFENDFSDDIGDLLFGRPISVKTVNYSSPDITSEGNLKKRWKIINGTRCLVKGGSGESLQEPLSEKIASLIMDSLGIDHVGYDVIWDDGRPYSVCPDFVDGDTEFISAFHVYRSMKNRGNASVYAHYVQCCAENGLDIVPALDRMIAVDYLIANNDRHMNNFGIIRDPRTLEWLSAAPVFDTGNSLGVGFPTAEIPLRAGRECKPFSKTFEEQIRLVSDLSWFDPDAVEALYPEIRSVLESSPHVSERRVDAVMGLLSSRLDSLRRRL